MTALKAGLPVAVRQLFSFIAVAAGEIVTVITGKNNRFPFLNILGYLKNAHKNPKFGRVRQVPIRELGWEFSACGSSTCTVVFVHCRGGK